MRPTDFAKALGVAIGLMAMNVVIAIVAVVIYSYFINPGQTPDYYQAAATRIIRWPVHIVGTAFFLVAGYLFARRPNRNGLVFATTFAVLYMIIDAATVGFQGIWNLEFALAMLANLIAALIGALLAGHRRIATAEVASAP